MRDTVGVIQARFGSHRLRGKVLAPIGERSLLDLLFDRLHGTAVREWWLATTRSVEDDVVADWAERRGLRLFRGARDDVLSRFVSILELSPARYLLRITADDPFVDAAVANCLIEQADRLAHRAALLTECERRLPLGYCPQLARTDAVLQLTRRIPDDQPYHRTHVLSYFVEQSEVLDVRFPTHWPERPHWRWTVDTQTDLEMAQAAFAEFGGAATSIDYPAMVARLERRPEIPARNADQRQKRLEEG